MTTSEKAYYLINTHNQQVPATKEFIPRDRGFYGRLIRIARKLKELEETLTEDFKFIK